MDPFFWLVSSPCKPLTTYSLTVYINFGSDCPSVLYLRYSHLQIQALIDPLEMYDTLKIILL